MVRYPFEFEATIELHDFGRMAYSVVYVPPAIAERLPIAEHPRLRVTGEVNGKRFDGALNPAGKGRHYLILSKRFLKPCRAEVGDKVWVQFDIADQDAVDTPEELLRALEANAAAAKAWQSLTPGKQRGLVYRVSSAKRAETRERRVEEVIEALIATSKEC
ncbi:MAG: YdeI/OmpD-associated family protein [Planctomycetota bacterium]